jgi:hypothetical protein
MKYSVAGAVSTGEADFAALAYNPWWVRGRRRTESMTDWYYARDDSKHGPISAEQLHELAQAGRIQPGDLILGVGAKEWVPGSSIQGLFLDGTGAQLGDRAASLVRPPRIDLDLATAIMVLVVQYLVLAVPLIGLGLSLGLDVVGWGLIVPAVIVVSQGLFVCTAGTADLLVSVRAGRRWLPLLVVSPMVLVLVLGAALALCELFGVSGNPWEWIVLLAIAGSWLAWFWRRSSARASGPAPCSSNVSARPCWWAAWSNCSSRCLLTWLSFAGRDALSD